jgi:stage V sporulation protein AF
MAFVAIANFTQPSYEMGYALKFMRMLSLALISLFSLLHLSVLGLILGAAVTVFLIVSTPVISGSKGYLYPLIPWNKRALCRLIFRVPVEVNKKESVDKTVRK